MSARNWKHCWPAWTMIRRIVFLVEAGQPGRRPNAHAFQEQFRANAAFFRSVAIPASGFGSENVLPHSRAAIALLAVAGLTELLGCFSALRAVHRDSPSFGANRGRLEVAQAEVWRFAGFWFAPTVASTAAGVFLLAVTDSQPTYLSDNYG